MYKIDMKAGGGGVVQKSLFRKLPIQAKVVLCWIISLALSKHSLFIVKFSLNSHVYLDTLYVDNVRMYVDNVRMYAYVFR